MPPWSLSVWLSSLPFFPHLLLPSSSLSPDSSPTFPLLLLPFLCSSVVTVYKFIFSFLFPLAFAIIISIIFFSFLNLPHFLPVYPSFKRSNEIERSQAIWCLKKLYCFFKRHNALNVWFDSNVQINCIIHHNLLAPDVIHHRNTWIMVFFCP